MIFNFILLKVPLELNYKTNIYIIKNDFILDANSIYDKLDYFKLSYKGFFYSDDFDDGVLYIFIKINEKDFNSFCEFEFDLFDFFKKNFIFKK